MCIHSFVCTYFLSGWCFPFVFPPTNFGDNMNLLSNFNNVLKNQFLFEWFAFGGVYSIAIVFTVDFLKSALFGGKNE